MSVPDGENGVESGSVRPTCLCRKGGRGGDKLETWEDAQRLTDLDTHVFENTHTEAYTENHLPAHMQTHANTHTHTHTHTHTYEWTDRGMLILTHTHMIWRKRSEDFRAYSQVRSVYKS